jgi:hypothetical protein
MLSGEHLRGVGGKGNLRPGRLDRALARVRRPLDRAFERNALALNSLAALSAAVTKGAGTNPQLTHKRPPRVLVVSLRGWSAHNAYELVIAQALRLRGAEVALLTCGGGMPACELGWARRAHPRPCDRCAWLTNRIVRVADLKHYRLGELLPWGEDPRRAPAKPAGAIAPEADDAAAISVAWLLKATQLDLVPDARAVMNDFSVAVEGVERAAETVLADFEPNVVFLLNGLFAAERTIRRLAIGRGIPAPTYEIAPRAGALVFSQDTPAPDYDVGRLWDAFGDRPLDAKQRSEVVHLLEDRARGVGAHESYYERPEQNHDKLRRHLGLSGRERLISLFTNVTWDSATIGHDIGFASMFDWVEHTVRLAEQRELVLVVRVHPAEARWGTLEQVREVILSRIGGIPANVRFVGAEDALSSYALLEISDLLLTYTTTVGLEAAARGKQVAVAGDTHYRGRGFTIDITGAEDLARVLALAPSALSAAEVERALRYAHMFFFRAMIPFPLVDVRDGRVRRFPQEMAALVPGAEPYLDWICARILDGGEFGLPDDLTGVSAARTEVA